MSPMENFSIVIPLYNEAENIPILAREIDDVLSTIDVKWESIWVDDGSTDRSWQELNKLAENHRGIRLSRNLGQSTAIMAGCDSANFDLIVTLDADLQNNPKDIPRLLSTVTPSLDCVCGIRKNRNDKLFSRKIPSLIANFIARKVTKVPVSDLGCTLRVFRKHLVTDNRLIGEMHRVLPIYFHLSGARIQQIEVDHRDRKFGESKYGLERIFKFIADIFLAKFMNKITTRPLYFFGLISLLLMVFGFIMVSVPIFGTNNSVPNLCSKPINFLFIFSGVSAFFSALIITLLGLLTEVLIRKTNNNNEESQYNIVEFK